MTAADELLSRNAAYQATHEPRSVVPGLGAIVVTCFDPRVDPAHVLGVRPGDAFVMRSVGGRVTPAILQNIAFITGVLAMNAGLTSFGDMEIVVMHHTSCGITVLAGSEHRPALARTLGADAGSLDTSALADPYQMVRADLDSLAASDLVPGEMSAAGLVFDLESGRAELVERRSPLR